MHKYCLNKHAHSDSLGHGITFTECELCVQSAFVTTVLAQRKEELVQQSFLRLQLSVWTYKWFAITEFRFIQFQHYIFFWQLIASHAVL